MKRSIATALAIGIAAAALVAGLHATGILLAPETWIANLAPSGSTRAIASVWQYVLLLLLAIAVAWLTLRNIRRNRVGWIVVAIIAELLALMWVCALYQVSFQPLPCILATLLSYAGAHAASVFLTRQRLGGALAALEGKLSPEQLSRVRTSDSAFDGTPRQFETSVIVCDIANKYDLADSSEPAVIAQTSESFNKRVCEVLLNAGAYLQTTDGEGVVAIFGFPEGITDHAEKAVHTAFDLVRNFANPAQGGNGENPLNVTAHIGVSSGLIIAAPANEHRDILIIGEAIELARRFSVANRFYGSRILIGPRTFELASSAFVARPIDFLTGVNSQERHEIYEPLAVAADAPSDLVARRDSFWNGVVLYREKRWAEAYSEFQKARGPGDEEDAPLNLYLRRLEPLALHLMDSPAENRF